jgi:hypothetical protein
MFQRMSKLFVAMVVAAGLLGGCVVRERVVVAAPPCPRAVWVEGHYGPYGRWYPAHWQCSY